MKVQVEFDFFDYFPPEKVKQLMECLKDIQDKKVKEGHIEIHIADSKVQRIVLKKFFEK